MLGATLLPALLLGGGALTLLPESPRWLLLSGGGSAQGEGIAKAALRRLRGSVPDAVLNSEFAAMAAAAVDSRAAAERSPGWSALADPRNARALYAGMSLMLFQQITGQPSVLYYATDIFQRAGFTSASAATDADVVLGVFKLAMTGVAVVLVDRVGRRPLLLGGVSALTLALVALGALSASASSSGESSAFASAAMLLVYVGAYQLSFGPIAWLLVGEMFPADSRSAATGVATLLNFGSNFGVSLALPLLQETLGQSGTYSLFAGLGALSLLSIYLTIPETKGLTLEQIQENFQQTTAAALPTNQGDRVNKDDNRDH